MRLKTFLRGILAGVVISISTPSLLHAKDPIPVVATFSILGDLVKQIGGKHISLATLVGPDGDAHVYKPTPADAKAVSNAKVLFVNGLEFEGWINRLVDASDFKGLRVVSTKGIEAIPFGEDGHHGDHAFEWAGVFNLKAGTYRWSFAKVKGKYADPAMKMVIQASDGIEASEEKAEELLEAKDGEPRRHNDVLVAKDTAYVLNFDNDKKTTFFSVNIKKAGKYVFFTEHMPFEFETDEHFFKDASGKDVEPIAQEPDAGHHGHDDHKDHGHAKHDDHKDDKHDDHKDHGHAKHDDHKDEKHDDHAGHDHGAFDPHAWQSAENIVIYLDNITAALAKADPSNASNFFKNREAYVAKVKALDAEISAKMKALPKAARTIITSHDAFGYFAKRYGLTFEAPQGMSTESEASAKDVAKLITQIREEKIRAVFVETITDNRLMEQIVRETGAKIGGTLYSDALSGPKGPAASYLDMMRHNSSTILGALTGS